MKKKLPKSTVLSAAAAFLLLFAAAGYFILFVPAPDRETKMAVPATFFCNTEENRIESQTDGNCSAYAAAYLLRHMGEETDGEMLAAGMRRIFGFVPASSVVRALNAYGYTAAAYHGSLTTLKQRLAQGIPVIVFIQIPGDTHYAVVTGYDEQYLYLADSLPENANAVGEGYNRRLSAREFLSLWETDSLLPDNIYIAITA